MLALAFSVCVIAQNSKLDDQNVKTPEEMNSLNQYASDSIKNFCESVAKHDCHTILVLPKVLSGEDDPLSGGEKRLSTNQIAIIKEKNIHVFLKTLEVGVTYMDDIKTGIPYEIVFLMNDQATNYDYRIQARTYDNKMILEIISKGGNHLFVETSPGFTEWLKGQFFKM